MAGGENCQSFHLHFDNTLPNGNRKSTKTRAMGESTEFEPSISYITRTTEAGYTNIRRPGVRFPVDPDTAARPKRHNSRDILQTAYSSCSLSRSPTAGVDLADEIAADS